LLERGAEFTPSNAVLGAVDCFGRQSDLPAVAALAVSGGSDSMSLCRLAQWYWGQVDKKIVVLTVDHGLRAESRNEAEQVAAWCADLGIEHHILDWRYDDKGNLSAAAREGRYRLMAEFCEFRGITHLYTGHTKDDQVETVLMRFARGSGVDGLAGMARETSIWGLRLVRPFILSETRDSLRAILREFGQDWIDDPTNDDPSYDRVKARSLLKQLEPLGLTRSSLSSLAYRMGLAKDVLQSEAEKLKETGLTLSPLGFAILDVDALGNGFRAPLLFEQQIVELALERTHRGGRTLKRCSFRPGGDYFYILRELSRCAPRSTVAQLNGIWDDRFYFEFEEKDGFTDLQVGAVGEDGIRQIPKDYNEFSKDWLNSPREARLATPGLWQGNVLVCAPCAPWSDQFHGPELRVKPHWSK